MLCSGSFYHCISIAVARHSGVDLIRASGVSVVCWSFLGGLGRFYNTDVVLDTDVHVFSSESSGVKLLQEVWHACDRAEVKSE